MLQGYGGLLLSLAFTGILCAPPNWDSELLPGSELKAHPRSNSTINVYATLGDEFTGLSLRCNTQHPGREDYALESLALAAIAAMKEEALQDYEAPLPRLDYVDIYHPENPIRLLMVAAPEAGDTKTVRSSMMWALKTLPLTLMRAHDMAYLHFEVWYRYRPLYQGVVTSRFRRTIPSPKQNGSAAAQQVPKSPFSLAVIPTKSTTIVLQHPSNLKDHPHYKIEFPDVPGHFIPQYRVFDSLLGLLLRLGKTDAARILDEVRLDSNEYQVWIFMREVQPGAQDHPFQQFHAVGILEAIARHMVSQAGQHGRYKEMAFRFLADGQLVGEGCLTRPVIARTWCEGLTGGGLLKPLSIGNASRATG